MNPLKFVSHQNWQFLITCENLKDQKHKQDLIYKNPSKKFFTQNSRKLKAIKTIFPPPDVLRHLIA